MGTLVMQKGKVNLEIHEKKASGPENFIHEHVVDRKLFEKDTSYKEKSAILSKFKVNKGEFILKHSDADDSKGNLAEIYLLRDEEDINKSQKLAILLSVSHIIADGRTVYNIFNMLDDSNPNAIKTLDRNTIEYNDQLYKHTNLAGKNGRNLLLDFGVKDILPWLAKSYTRSGKAEYDVKLYNYKVNLDEVNKVKKEYENLAINQFVSTNDVLTSHFYQKNEKADYVNMNIDVRPRLMKYSFENEGQNESENASSPFHLDLAGNYVATLILRKQDLSSPLNIRKALNQKFTKSTNKKTDHQKRPPYKVIRSYPCAVSTNWATFYKPVKIDGLELELQVPFFDEKSLDLRALGLKLCWEDSIIIFKCNDRDYGVYIITGSNKISEESLEGDVMFGERLI